MKYLFSFLLIGTIASAVMVGINGNEVYECSKWKSEAKEFSNYYITQWQHDQCDAHGIKINAPVK